jgi:hypothetical protein
LLQLGGTALGTMYGNPGLGYAAGTALSGATGGGLAPADYSLSSPSTRRSKVGFYG